MFIYDTSIRLHQTDAAGLMFFAQLFTLAHDAYETFVESIGFSFDRTIRSTENLLPIVHAEADYLVPLRVGDKISVRMRLDQVGTTSFILAYEMTNSAGALTGTVKTVHVWTDRTTMQKVPLPDWLKGSLAKLS